MRHALANARVHTDAGFVRGLAVIVDAGRIDAIVADDDPRLAALPVHDLRGNYLLPGFIDCQVNGGGGVLFNDAPTVDGIRAIAAAHRRYGTTGLLPTLISDTRDAMTAALAAVRDAIAAGVPGVLGIHLEGPFLSPARHGAHDPRHFAVPDAADAERVATATGGVTVVTVAPERVPAQTIAAWTARGVIVCAGHTHGTYADIRRGLDAGMRGFTHLYNAMTPLTGREPGAVGAALSDPHSWCGLIVDGHHVHPQSLQVALRAKPRRCMLVTDAMPPVGADSPDFMLNGETITARDGICRNAAGALAGSALDMAAAVRNAVELLGVELHEAVRMASTHPAEFLRMAHVRGRIAAGLQADLVAMDDDYRITRSWVAGA